MNSLPAASASGAPQAQRVSTRLTALPRGDVEHLLGLIADEVRILLPSWSDADRGTGGDFDCAVRGIDPRWPLRLDPRTKLCQSLEYDIGARFWILEREGLVFAIDAIDDPWGLGRYAFPTAPFFDEGGLVPPAGARAAYRTIKRLRKGVQDVDDWRATAALASGDAKRFEDLLVQLVGSEIGRELGETVLAGHVPGDRLSGDVRRKVLIRRISSPLYASALALRGRRVLRRLRQPTGLLVALVGPDGAGKSTLARSLPDACEGLFRREALFHWRPGVLPRPGSFVRSPASDPCRPHQRDPHSRAISTALLIYFWTDFLVGSWTRFYPLRVRTGLVVLERGWWDILVDPRRYRLDVPPALVKALGRLLPAPDLTLVCEAPVEVVTARKNELAGHEVFRQTQAWRSPRMFRSDVRYLDASDTPERMRDAARAAITDHLETRAIGRLGPGWTRLPPGTSDRWSVPRGPGRMASASLLIYQPMSLWRRAAWELAQVAARSGGFRLLPRNDPAPRAVRAKVAPFVPRRGSVALARANHPGRYVGMVLDAHGQPHIIVKIATDEAGQRALQEEASRIAEVGSLLSVPLRPPRILDHRDGALALLAERWRPRWRPWDLDHELVGALGAFFATRRRVGSNGIPVGPSHGDFAPWNLLRTDQGWLLIDWEYASTERPAFYDFFHHLVQSHVHLGQPSRRVLLDAVIGQGRLASLLSTYGRAADVDVGRGPEFFRLYAEISAANLEPRRPDGRAGLDVRNDLIRWVENRP
jgi:Phosphotransferase enzyme family